MPNDDLKTGELYSIQVNQGGWNLRLNYVAWFRGRAGRQLIFQTVGFFTITILDCDLEYAEKM